MKPFILHCREVIESRDFVTNYPSYSVFDWYDLADQQTVLKLVGELHVTGCPSVVVEAPAWFIPPSTYGEVRKDFPASFVAIYNPQDWDEVENQILELNKRSKGDLPGIEIPEVENIIWGDPPEPPEGKLTVFDGWEVADNVATRKWRFDDVPPPQPEVAVLGDE